MTVTADPRAVRAFGEPPLPEPDQAPANAGPGYVERAQNEVDAEHRAQLFPPAKGESGAPKPGWYRLPAEPDKQGWWDGEQWIGEHLPADQPAPDEPVPPAGTTTVPLGSAGRTVRVLRQGLWRSSALRALKKDNDFEVWAEKCLWHNDYETWVEVDPTLDEVERFFTDYGQLDQSPGKS